MTDVLKYNLTTVNCINVLRDVCIPNAYSFWSSNGCSVGLECGLLRALANANTGLVINANTAPICNTTMCKPAYAGAVIFEGSISYDCHFHINDPFARERIPKLPRVDFGLTVQSACGWCCQEWTYCPVNGGCCQWFVPSGAKFIRFQLWGGGGPGGCSFGGAHNGAGWPGSSGAYASVIMPAPPAGCVYFICAGLRGECSYIEGHGLCNFAALGGLGLGYGGFGWHCDITSHHTGYNYTGTGSTLNPNWYPVLSCNIDYNFRFLSSGGNGNITNNLQTDYVETCRMHIDIRNIRNTFASWCGCLVTGNVSDTCHFVTGFNGYYQDVCSPYGNNHYMFTNPVIYGFEEFCRFRRLRGHTANVCGCTCGTIETILFCNIYANTTLYGGRCAETGACIGFGFTNTECNSWRLQTGIVPGLPGFPGSSNNGSGRGDVPGFCGGLGTPGMVCVQVMF